MAKKSGVIVSVPSWIKVLSANELATRGSRIFLNEYVKVLKENLNKKPDRIRIADLSIDD